VGVVPEGGLMGAPTQDVETLRRWFRQARAVVVRLEAEEQERSHALEGTRRELASARASLAQRRVELEAAESGEARP
jgi:hypothetical protein